MVSWADLMIRSVDGVGRGNGEKVRGLTQGHTVSDTMEMLNLVIFPDCRMKARMKTYWISEKRWVECIGRMKQIIYQISGLNFEFD